MRTIYDYMFLNHQVGARGVPGAYWIRDLVDAVQTRIERNRTRAELESLSDRELWDIGLQRSDIKHASETGRRIAR